MPELGPYGSVRGALSNEHPYRDLRNVVANYPFEKSLRFAGIQPNSGHRDHSRLSCDVVDTQLGRGSQQVFSRGPWSSSCIAEMARTAAISADPKMIQWRANPATLLLSLRWTFSAKRACVVITGTEPDRLSSSPPPAPMGLRGVWVTPRQAM